MSDYTELVEARGEIQLLGRHISQLRARVEMHDKLTEQKVIVAEYRALFATLGAELIILLILKGVGWI